MANIETAKKIAKDLNVKGFRKLKLQRVRYTIGKQCSFMSEEVANTLIDNLTAAGWEVADLKTCRELANKGLLDSVTIKPMGAA